MTWNGKGVDPWLPDRLAAETRITAAENRLYNSWWGSFAAWIVRVKRGVLAGVVPDPHTVFAYAPLWAEHMGRFVAGPVKQTVGLAYEALFGKGYAFDARPAVVRHLAEVSNRLVRTPDVVFDVLAGEIAKGAGAGESIPAIADRVETVLSTTSTPTWQGRAVTVARTEAISSLNAGRTSAFADVATVLGGEFENQWLSTLDSRCRPAHVLADLQRVPVGTPFDVCGEQLMFPGDPTGSPGCVINCRCSLLLVRPGEDVDMTGRGFTDADDWWAAQIEESK